MQKQHASVLTSSREKFFSQLGFTRTRGIYLAGGTALALQISHRTSVDFDFYSPQHFHSGVLPRFFRTHLKGWKYKIVRNNNDTFEMNVHPDIHVSCFYYEYPLLERPHVVRGVFVAGLKDIAAMKLVAIAQRGKRRDFIDMYYLLQQFSLKEILRFTQEKYSHFDIYYGLRGLLYFKDADDDIAIERAAVFDHALTWRKTKETIEKAVRGFHNTV
ncbi:nucleotidyl transferase AbiEii/AbiGii toxin family protein [Candidatus Uhrbacteria bacterium]|nr:nucleotidyl transferase AbiEii/AbiGii toxin family protein [Candidatus Uhrbacteria bacterium]